MHRIIIAGSRGFTNYKLLTQVLSQYINGMETSEIEIISGTARGTDQLGEQFAKENNLKLTRFPADWSKYGKSAGYIRNSKMAEYAAQEYGVLFAFWDGESRGTQHMINLAKKAKLDVKITLYEKI